MRFYNILFAIAAVVLLVGCDIDYYTGQRPVDYQNTVWICEDFGITLSVKEGGNTESFILLEDKKIEARFLWSELDSGVSIAFFWNGHEYVVKGKCRFGSQAFTVSVEDSAGFWQEEPELLFTRIDELSS